MVLNFICKEVLRTAWALHFTQLTLAARALMLLKLVILSHFLTPCIRILTVYLYLVKQILNVSRDAIDRKTFYSALRASIILDQAIC